MGLYQLFIALLVPNISLQHFTQLKKSQFYHNATFFFRHKCSHPTFFLHLMETNFFGVVYINI